MIQIDLLSISDVEQMNEVRDFGVNQFSGKYLTDTGYKDVVQEQG